MAPSGTLIKTPFTNKPLAAITITTFIAIFVSISCLNSGIFVIFQNIFYVPISIACIYYAQKGFVYSVLLSAVYVLFVVAFEQNQIVVTQALTKFFLFTGIAEIIVVISKTKQKKSNGTIRETEMRCRFLFENSSNGVLTMDPATARPLEFNETAHKQLGYTREEFAGLSIFDLDADSTPEQIRSRMAQVAGTGHAEFETRQRTKQGEIRDVHVKAQITEILGHKVDHCIWRDITDFKRMEGRVKETNETLNAIIRSSPLAIVALYPVGNVTRWNPSAERMFGWSESEVLGKFMPTVSEHQLDHHSVQRKRVLQGESLTLIETRRLRKDGSLIDTSISAAPLHDSRGRAIGIISVMADISDRKRAEAQLKLTVENLRTALGVTVRAMVSAVEARDPYTAGHQQRTADLARAIAVEMKLPQEQIEGIRMAASIHDIGKLSTPAEILTKPTKLSITEFSLIKEHPRKGFEILKDAKSPWPLSEMIYQHHERMDGSGYPRNLRGNEILIEARIIAVADVVESMASNRPYRPALGIDAALGEIEKNKGILYDAAAADCCLRLFREKSFDFNQ